MAMFMGETALAIPSVQWPYLPILARLALALGLGLFVGLERQRRGKEAGVRTFSFTTLLGCLGGLLGGSLAPLSIGVVAILVALLNLHRIYVHKDTELTTSAALLVMAFTGLLCGQGHTLTPAALAVLTAALLAWKESLAGFSIVITETEVRSAILLAVLAVVIYPALPVQPIDPWGMVAPRAAWLTVLLIAGIGFANYVLLKLYGPRAVELTGFLGGLVNSTVVVTALAESVREQKALRDSAYRGIVLATLAMLLRNAVLLGILAPRSLVAAAPSLVAMLVAGSAFVTRSWRSPGTSALHVPTLQLSSPFSLSSALKFGALFVLFGVGGAIAQRELGEFGFYGVSLIGGALSSASAVASAALLAAHGSMPFDVAGRGAALASVTSAFVNLPLAARIAREQPLTRRIVLSLGAVVVLGIAGAYFGALLGVG
jgi:uncharacterized membrane protein (DUF4010 family)